MGRFGEFFLSKIRKSKRSNVERSGQSRPDLPIIDALERSGQSPLDLSVIDALFEHLESNVNLGDCLMQVLKDLEFLRAFLMDPPPEFIQDGTFNRLQSLASDVQSVLSLSGFKKMNEAGARQLCTQLLGLLKHLRAWTSGAKLIYARSRKPSRFYYPKTGQLIFIDGLVENLEELVTYAPSPIRPLKHFLSRVQQVIKFWRSRITVMPKEAIIRSVGNLVYEVEYVIDSFQVGEFPTWHYMFWLLNILNELENVGIDVRNDEDDEMVGYEDEKDNIFRSVMDFSSGYTVIPVVAAAGQGKTTLVRWIYDHTSTVEKFEIRLWCCVSQEYKRRDLLLQLLGHIIELSDLTGKEDEDLSDMLLELLKGRRFLIVLDDLWSFDAWEDLKRCLPSVQHNCRIIFTTRILEMIKVAPDAAWKWRWEGIVHLLRRFSDEESWELLEKKLFKNERCPPELFVFGWEIARRCEGLPLSVISTAKLLGKMEKTVDRWERVAESLSSHILGDSQAESKNKIETSYRALPDHLKPCFLYFAMFPKDKEIPVPKLIRLWIAEGFIKHTYLKSLEDVAESYLVDLVSRTLVTAAQSKSMKGVKSCRVHDLLYEFCISKAKEENFLQHINGYDEHFPPSNSNQNLPLDPPITYHLRRLGIYSKRNHFFTLKPYGPFVHTILFSAATERNPSFSYNISFMSLNFKVLTILDLEDINIGSLEGIDVLVLLRYLAVQGSIDFIPSSIANLWNLETLIFKGLGTEVVKIPDSIWDMAKLRHLHIEDGASFELSPARVEEPSLLDNLQTFSTPSFAYGDGSEMILRRINRIKKLKCIFLDSLNGRMRNQFPELGFLNELESLKVFYNGVGKYSHHFNLPLNLKKLTMSNFGMPWSEISQLGRLPNLEVLKLLCNAFEGEIWKMYNQESFPRLRFLKLEDLNIAKWRASGENFPVLETLILNKCERLKEIPSDFEEIYTLRKIDVSGCHPSLESLARSIENREGKKKKRDGPKIEIYYEVDHVWP